MAFTEAISLSNSMYDHITNKIRVGYPNACVLYIDRIINASLLDAYNERKQAIAESTTVTEMELFHGTKADNVDSICNNGFLVQYNRTSAYGLGTYFSTNPSYSMFNYTNVDKRGVSFVCDVLIGKCELGGHSRKIKADNAVDNLTKPSIYVTPYDDGCYPKYLVAFHKNAK